MINLTQKPYNLTDNEINLLTAMIEKMTIEEKIGQLFFGIAPDENQTNLTKYIKKYQPGGLMFRPGPAEKIKRQILLMQTESNVPLFFAANLESGGNGIINEGTWVGNPLQMAATNQSQSAYQLGKIASYEAQQVGCNMAFSPIVDIDYNFKNPITNTRTFGSDPQRVLTMSQAQIRGFNENNVIPTIKHYPGDGVDERDQHLLSSINSLSAEDWLSSYGKIYQTLIDEGIPAIMIGHIYQPAMEKLIDPSMKPTDFLPASASEKLINKVLRDKLGFNGLAITDATAMVGYNVIMDRKELLPTTINAGIDMILFNKNIDEDYEIIRNAVKSGIISKQRLNEAVTRILATKLSKGIMDIDGKFINTIPNELNLHSDQHLVIADEIADQSVTLVKDRDKILPISPTKTPRVRLVVLGDSDDGGFKEGGKVTDLFIDNLEQLGFHVSMFNMDFHEIFEEGATDLKQKFDLAIYVANVETASNQTTTRLNWIQLMAANSPWFSKSIPTLFISTANPYHLFDVPYISTYINAYSGNPSSINAIFKKITGKETFKGINPVDPFCGDFVAKL